MSEFVEENLESTLEECEEMLKEGLLSQAEMKSLMKKRRHYEYKLQKNCKDLSDFLNYIRYEIALLDLIRLRQRGDKYGTSLYYSIAKRINKLYKMAENRFPADKQLWDSHAQFLIRMDWKEYAEKIQRRSLTLFPHDVTRWIKAAQFQLETRKRPQNARNLFWEVLRFNPNNQNLYLAYFKCELIYSHILRKRRDILIKDEDEMELEDNDAVLKGEIALVVWRQAIQNVEDPIELAAKVTHLLIQDFPQDVEILQKVTEYLKESTEPRAVDTLARAALWNNHDFKACREAYEAALEDNPTPEILHFYLDTLKALVVEAEEEAADALADLFLKWLMFGDQRGILSEEHYVLWVQWRGSDGIIVKARKHYPTSVSLFRLALEASEGSELLRVFKEGISSIQPSDRKGFIRYILAKRSSISLEKLYSDLRELLSDNKDLKTLYLDHLYTLKGLGKCRKFYGQNAYVPPFDLDFHYKMLELEKLSNEGNNRKEMRTIYENATRQFGTFNSDIWFEWLEYEKSSGSGANYANVRNRALGAVNSVEWKNKFVHIL